MFLMQRDYKLQLYEPISLIEKHLIIDEIKFIIPGRFRFYKRRLSIH